MFLVWANGIPSVNFPAWKTGLCITYFREDLYSSNEAWRCAAPGSYKKNLNICRFVFKVCLSICSVILPGSHRELKTVGGCVPVLIFFFHPSSVGNYVNCSALSPAMFFPELPGACCWCGFVRSWGDDAHSRWGAKRKSHPCVTFYFTGKYKRI